MDDDFLKRDPWEKVKRGLRLMEANREREVSAKTIDELVGEEHVVRWVWEYCLGLDLSSLYQDIRAREGHSGRPPYDPLVLFALWLYATLRGISSASELCRQCQSESGFQWLAGGLTPTVHILSDFRTEHLETLSNLLVQSVAVLRHAGMPVDLDEVAQDGVRVRAHAGAASFRSAKSLGEELEDAKALVERMRSEYEHDPSATSRRQHAARQRAARERLERVQQAIEQLPRAAQLMDSPEDDELHDDHDEQGPDDSKRKPPKDGGKRSLAQDKSKKKKKKKKPRRSTTDPDSRVMKMADGGFRPAYNIEFAVDTFSLVVVGLAVSQSGSDMGQMLPMYEGIVETYDVTPLDYLVDGGFTKHADIEALHQRGTTVLAPVRKPDDGSDPHLPKPGDSEAIAQWRQRMAEPRVKEQYKNRAASVELVNAQARNHGLRLLLVNGLQKVTAVAFWHALAHNFTRYLAWTRPLQAT